MSFSGAGLMIGGFVHKEFCKSISSITLDEASVDQVYLMDPAQSFYLQCSKYQWNGFAEMEKMLQEKRAQYDRIVFIGASMGASAVLLFAHLADQVIAFNPIVPN